MKTLLSLLSIAFTFTLNAQVSSVDPTEQCATNSVIELQKSSVALFDKYQAAQEQKIRDQIVNNQSKLLGVDEFVIPVVVHIVYKDANGNIPYEQVLSQIDALNAAFQGTNSGLSTPIRFCLAKTALGSNNWTDPTNEPGVMRYEDISPNSMYADHQITHQSAYSLLSLTHPNPSTFPFENYLNIWVVNSINSPALVQGYAPLPIMPEIGINGYPLDGVVVRSDVFGDNANPAYCQCFNLASTPVDRTLGKVTVHEVGHYLRLYHTFHQGCTGGQQSGASGSGDCELFGDFVCDTPPCTQPPTANAYCSSGQVNSCTAPFENQISYPSNITMAGPNDGYDMVENYMNYVADPCYATFSAQQVDRMVAFIQNSRFILTSMENLFNVGVVGANGCVPPELSAVITGPVSTCTDYDTPYSAPVGYGYSNAAFSWTVTPNIGVQFTGGTNANDPSVNIFFANPGNYTITLTVVDANDVLSNSIDVTVSTCSPIMSSQSNWYFGKFGSIDFSSGIPIVQTTSLTNNTMDSAYEQAVTESDPNTGELIYYSDGQNVWNSDHVLINPGAPLEGTVSTSQIISVPNPANSDQYYLIIPTITTAFGPPQFALLDFSGTGTIASTGYLDMPSGSGNTSESITAIPHCNGTDYWIILHGDFSDRNFYVYRLSNQGFSNADFTSSTPDVYDNNGTPFFLGSDIGFIKSSASGSRIAMSSRNFSAPFGQAGIATYDFNTITGEISNENVHSTSQFYACSFPPNNEDILYATHTDDRVYQINLLTGALVEIAPQGSAQSMQLAPDGKIYLSKYWNSILSAIEDPDNLSAPSYNSSAIDLSATSFSIKGNGLLDLIDAVKPSPITPDFTFVYSPNCTDVEFEIDNCWETYEIAWNFGDNSICSGNLNDPIVCPNSQGTFRNPTHTFASGTYIVTLTITFGSDVQTVSHQVTIGASGSPINGLFEVCTGEIVEYSTPFDSLYTYDWTITGGTFSGGNTSASGSIVSANWLTSGSGTITLTTTNTQVPTCSATVTQDIIIKECHLGLDDLGANNISVAIYPNPSDHVITIELMNLDVSDQSQLELYDLAGKLVYSAVFKDKQMSIYVRDFALGTYFVKVSTPLGSVQRRVVFQ
ncbi:MAG: T9SS type A sorting domain-containing protein [Crocinitomicaceae bacterium]